MSEEDLYEILGVSKNASKEEIKSAYKKLAKTYHPDISKDSDAEEKLKKINVAYSILSDDQKRKQYDTYGTQGTNFNNFRNSQGFSGFNSNFGFDFSDIFSSFMNDNEDDDMFSSFGFGSRRTNTYSKKDLDLKYKLEISFIDAAKGIKKEIILNRDQECEYCSGTGSKSLKKEICSTCNGRGQVISTRRTPFGTFSVQQICPTCKGKGKVIKDPCPYCNGKGYRNKESKIKVDIPAGIDNNNIIKLKDLGNIHNGRRGDLYLHILVEPHKFFKRDGADLYLELPITYSELILGANIKIKGIQDIVNVKVPPNTQTHTLFKIKGKGLSDINRRGLHGDLYIKFILENPPKISREYKNILKNIEELEEKDLKKKLREKYKDILK
jgi:molecular chaperone DnaJ